MGALRRDPCAYCGLPSEHVDHIMPRSHGGADSWENYTAACASCNISKGKRSMLGFLLARTMVPEMKALRAQLSALP